jgi:hypothetical protein
MLPETLRIRYGSSDRKDGLKTVGPIIGPALGVGFGDDLDFAGSSRKTTE